jgi:hypothetical protein
MFSEHPPPLKQSYYVAQTGLEFTILLLQPPMLGLQVCTTHLALTPLYCMIAVFNDHPPVV